MRRLLLLPLLLAGCHATPEQPAGNSATPLSVETPGPVATAQPAASPANALPPVAPIPPGQPGGLPDDRTPISEAPFTPDSAQGAADVVQRFYALVESGRYAEAYKLREPGGPSPAEFSSSFAHFSDYHAQVGAPGRIDAGAGQRYVTVLVQTYGRDRDGKEFHMSGSVTLHRTGDIDGATAEQRSWRIRSIDLKPVG